MTAQIANVIDDVLQPQGVAVVIEATHHCMTTRGVHKPGTAMVTSRMLGVFRDNPDTRRELLGMIGRSRPLRLRAALLRCRRGGRVPSERKGVGEGKGVTVCVDEGGRGILK